MARLLDTLGIGRSALQAHQQGASIAGHNIANVGTVGFKRQDIVLTAQRQGDYGVSVTNVYHTVDIALMRRLETQAGQTSFAQERAYGLSHLEEKLPLSGELGLGAALNDFFSGFRELAAAPSDRVLRSSVLSRSNRLAERVRQTAATLSDARKSADNDVVALSREVNAQLAEVARLNHAIAASESNGQQALELRDQRDVTVRNLSELTGATALSRDDGSIDLLIDGIGVVQGQAVRPLELTLDTSGSHRIHVDGSTSVALDGRIASGKLGAALALRDVDIPQATAALDQFAYDLATTTNNLHQTGYGLDGISGRTLFVAPTGVGGAAAALTVDATLRPEHLAAASSSTTVPGDGQHAQAMAALEQQLTASGQSLPESLTLFVTQFSGNVRDANAANTVNVARLSHLQNAYESVSGVSIEEQMMSLSRYQRAYDAAAKIITTVDAMLDTLFRM